MQVLVIGGTRFIGRWIVDRLLRDGHAVTLLNRGVSPDPFGTTVRRVVGDRRDPETLAAAAARREWDAVVDVNAYHERETEAAIDAFRDRTGHWVHVSTASVYLIRDGLLPPFREADFAGKLAPKTPGQESSWLYAYHKRRCEEALDRAWHEHRFPATSLRLPMVVGPHDYTCRSDAYLGRLLDGGPLILPEGGLNSWGFLWVGDVADTLAENLANVTTFGRAYNLAQREILTLRQFVEAAAVALDRRPRLLSLPIGWLKAVGLGLGFSPYTHHHDIALDASAAAEDLLFRPTSPAEWIPRLAEEFRGRWNGRLEAWGQSRGFELALAREVEKIRLPAYGDAEGARAGSR